MDRQRRNGTLGIALAGTLLVSMIGALAAPGAGARVGMLAHYEFCEDGDWLAAQDVAVDARNGDIWFGEGVPLAPRVHHTSTTGRYLGVTPGSIPPSAGPTSFGGALELNFTREPRGMYVADTDGTGRGRLLRYSADTRTPAFRRHFVVPDLGGGRPRSGFDWPRDLLVVVHSRLGRLLIALDDYGITRYRADGTYLDRLFPSPGPFDQGNPALASWGSFPNPPAGITLVEVGQGVFLVSDPGSRRIKRYVINEADPASGRPAQLVHLPDSSLTVGRVSEGPSSSFWAVTDDGVARYSGDSASLIEAVKVNGVRGLDVEGDEVWIARSDGILRLGPRGDPNIPPPQDRYPNRCGPPGITSSVPGLQPVLAEGKVAVDLACNEACRMGVAGTINVPGTAATYKLVPVTRSLRRNRRVRLKLGLTSAALRAARRARARGKRSLVTIKLTARDNGGTVGTKTLARNLG